MKRVSKTNINGADDRNAASRVGKAYRDKGSKLSEEQQMKKLYLACPWDRWWDEFLTARDRNGELTYPTSWSFAKVHGNTRWERTVIFWCIGPKPVKVAGLKDKEQPIQWLGDWMLIRSETFNYSDERVNKLQEIIKERGNALEAARGVAHVWLNWVGKAQLWSQDIESYFKGVLMNPSLPIAAAERRVKIFLDLQKKVIDIQSKALDKYMECLGCRLDDVTLLANVAAGGVRQSLQESTETPENDDEMKKIKTLALIMNTFERKSKIYGLEMPEADLIKKVEGEHEVEKQHEKVLA